MMEKGQEKIEVIGGCEIFSKEIFKGVVTSIKEYGAFVELNGGHQGLLHGCDLSHDPDDGTCFTTLATRRIWCDCKKRKCVHGKGRNHKCFQVPGCPNTDVTEYLCKKKPSIDS